MEPRSFERGKAVQAVRVDFLDDCFNGAAFV